MNLVAFETPSVLILTRIRSEFHAVISECLRGVPSVRETCGIFCAHFAHLSEMSLAVLKVNKWPLMKSLAAASSLVKTKDQRGIGMN